MTADLFFASYARADTDLSVKKFIKELRKQIRSIAGLNVLDNELDQVGFFDTSNILTGDDWRQVLGDALRTCKVCICLCSPTYFNRLYCGKEFQVFSQRRDAWLAIPGNEDKTARVIIPVLWIRPRDPMPEGFEVLQQDDQLYPPRYKTEGLKTLAEFPSQSESFKKVVKRVAALAWDAVRDIQLPPLAVLPPFSEIPSSFHKPTRYGLVAVTMAPGGPQWRPFADGGTIEHEVESIASQQRTRLRMLDNNASLIEKLAESNDYREAVAIITSPDAFLSAAFRQTLQDIARRDYTNVAVLLLWDRPRVQEMLDAVHAAAPQVLSQVISASSALHDLAGIVSAPVFRRQLAVTWEKLRRGIVTAEPAPRASDPELERQAYLNGVPIDRAATLQNIAGGRE
jgi:hypothetical protein